MPSPDRPLLEVIVLDAADARAAAMGGADRLEVVRDMAAEGLTPEVETVARIRDAVDLPLRVMLRDEAAFQIAPPALDALCATACELQDAGADAFVFGFLTDAGDLDMGALGRVAGVCARPWTLHRAFDHTARPREAYRQAGHLPGIDRILTSGGRAGLRTTVLAARAAWQTPGGPVLVAGGGLHPEHVGPLRRAGLAEFHVGSGARPRRSFEAPVDRSLVARFAELVHGS